MRSFSFVVVAGLALGAQSGSNNASPPPGPAVAPATTPLEHALAAARVSGKPVLVIVTGPDVRAMRGRWLTDLLMLEGGQFYAQLALVEVAFATKSELLAVLPADLHVAAQSSEVGLVDVLGDVPTFISLLESSLCRALADGTYCADYCEGLRRLGAELELHLFFIGQYTSPERERVARARLTAAQLRDLELALADAHRADTDVAVCAAWCYYDDGFFGEGRWNDGGPEGWRTDIVNAARVEWESQTPYGARWAQFDGSHWHVQALQSDDERAFGLLEARVQDVDPRALSISKVFDSNPCNGPCGTGYTSRLAYSFLDEYTRVLVDATDLD